MTLDEIKELSELRLQSEQHLRAENTRLQAALHAADEHLRNQGISIHDDLRQKIHSALALTH